MPPLAPSTSEEDTENKPHADSRQERRGGRGKLVAAGCLIAVIVSAGVLFGDAISLKSLAAHEVTLRSYQEENPVLIYGLAFLAYVAVTGLSLPGAAGLTLLFGWYFGAVRGVLLVSFASTSGATLAFLISRYLLRDSIEQRFGTRLQRFNESLEREGAFYLFTLRLIPAVPFFVINAVMGLTPLKVRTFWWVSQLGMLPGTIIYVYAGSTFPDLQTLSTAKLSDVFSKEQLLQITAAFMLLAVFPFAARFALNRLRRGLSEPAR